VTTNVYWQYDPSNMNLHGHLRVVEVCNPSGVVRDEVVASPVEQRNDLTGTL
jgi:hypothetical protein